jgi:hypothetical protein
MKWPTSFLSIGFEDPSGPRGHTVPVFYCFLGWSVETHGAIVDTHRGDEPRATSTGMFKTSGAERWLRGRTMLVVAVRGATIRTVLAPRRRCCCYAGGTTTSVRAARWRSCSTPRARAASTRAGCRATSLQKAVELSRSTPSNACKLLHNAMVPPGELRARSAQRSGATAWRPVQYSRLWLRVF